MLEVSIAQFFADLANPQLSFLLRAVIIAVIAAVVCGLVGGYVVLRGMAFIGDAVSHAVFPGLTIAFSLQVSLLAGGAVAGGVVAVLIALFSRRDSLKTDAVIGIFFAAAFALGNVIISRQEGYTASLTSFLFGSLTGTSASQIWIALGVAAAVGAFLFACGPQLRAVCLDRESGRALGLPVMALGIALYLAITAAIVISVNTVGNVLVLALLITPAATARLVCDRLTPMLWLAAALGAAGSVVGIYLAWAIDLPAGATIVLTLTALFLCVWALAPLKGRRHANERLESVQTP